MFVRISAIVTLCAIAMGCASTSAPSGWLASRQDVGSDGFGGWMEVELQDKSLIRGEFIAFMLDTLYVLPQIRAQESGCLAIATPAVRRARLTAFRLEANTPATVTLLGTLSTISHGTWLILSAPIWIIGGSAAAGSYSHESIHDYPKESFNDMVRFARFPQGLPDKIDLAHLKRKSN